MIVDFVHKVNGKKRLILASGCSAKVQYHAHRFQCPERHLFMSDKWARTVCPGEDEFSLCNTGRFPVDELATSAHYEPLEYKFRENTFRSVILLFIVFCCTIDLLKLRNLHFRQQPEINGITYLREKLPAPLTCKRNICHIVNKCRTSSNTSDFGLQVDVGFTASRHKLT